MGMTESMIGILLPKIGPQVRFIQERKKLRARTAEKYAVENEHEHAVQVDQEAGPAEGSESNDMTPQHDTDMINRNNKDVDTGENKLVHGNGSSFTN